MNLADSGVEGRGALHFQKNQGVEIADAPKLDADKPFSMSVSFYLPEGGAELHDRQPQQHER